MDDRDLYAGLIRLHILHQAVYGMWILDELVRHKYRMNAGTLYPRS